jgi:hypothetical protein
MSARIASDRTGNLIAVWESPDGSGTGAFAQRYGGLRPAALAVDTIGNGVLEPGEATVRIVPSWSNASGAAQAFGGVLSAFAGPAPAVHTILDAAADYGTVPDGAVGNCATDCYAVSVGVPPTRPAHWDSTALETLTPDAQGQQIAWTLHVGDSFTDVPRTSPFYRFIEVLLHNGVTTGCGPGIFCPISAISREQMAVFLLVGKEGTAFLPPACGATPVFADVPPSSPFCRWVEELARRAVVSGCGGGNYCPTADVTREQMPVFLVRLLEPTVNPPPCVPPNMFLDVPETSPFCRWIEYLAGNGGIAGCGAGNYCPLAPVTREQMGVFISVTFGLTLYGV